MTRVWLNHKRACRVFGLRGNSPRKMWARSSLVVLLALESRARLRIVLLQESVGARRSVVGLLRRSGVAVRLQVAAGRGQIQARLLALMELHLGIRVRPRVLARVQLRRFVRRALALPVLRRRVAALWAALFRAAAFRAATVRAATMRPAAIRPVTIRKALREPAPWEAAPREAALLVATPRRVTAPLAATPPPAARKWQRLRNSRQLCVRRQHLRPVQACSR